MMDSRQRDEQETRNTAQVMVGIEHLASQPDLPIDLDLACHINRLTLLKTDRDYWAGDSYTTVKCLSAQKDIHVQLTWPQLGSDFDLHFIRPGGAYGTSPDDCYYNNRNPHWGVAGMAEDNPALDVDCITGCTIENIVLQRAFNGAFTIKVHYFSDHGHGPSSPRVRVWVAGQQLDFGPQQMTSGQVWDVATVTWPAGAVSVIDQVRDPLPGEEFPAKP